MRRFLAIALVALIVSPVTVPLSSCSLFELLGAPMARTPHVSRPSPLEQYRPVSARVVPGEDWNRIKDDSHWRQAVGWSQPRIVALPRPTETHRQPPRATRMSSLVLRI